MKETREAQRVKNPKSKRNWIPLGRLISDILTENGLIAHLEEANLLGELEPTCGKALTGKNLLKRKLIDKLLVEPTPYVSATVTRRRILVEDFPLFNSGDHPEIILHFIEACKESGIPIDPAWLQGRNVPAPEVFLQKQKKRQAGEGPSARPQKKKKKSSGMSTETISICDSVHISPSAEPQTL